MTERRAAWPTLRVPPLAELRRLFAWIAEDRAELLPGCRWLVLGPELAAIVVPDDEPSVGEMIALLRLLRRREPELEDLGRTLVHRSEHGEEADVEVCVDRLLETPGWQHPTQVLERPRPDFRKLLAAARVRWKRARGKNRAALGTVIERLEVAVRIEDDARERREKMRRGRRRRN